MRDSEVNIYLYVKWMLARNIALGIKIDNRSVIIASEHHDSKPAHIFDMVSNNFLDGVFGQKLEKRRLCKLKHPRPPAICILPRLLGRFVCSSLLVGDYVFQIVPKPQFHLL